MFITALFTIANTWKQPKYPLRGMDKEDVVHIYTTEYYSAIKKNERKGICSNEDGTREYHTE